MGHQAMPDMAAGARHDCPLFPRVWTADAARQAQQGIPRPLT
jgi:hypothetical protein